MIWAPTNTNLLPAGATACLSPDLAKIQYADGREVVMLRNTGFRRKAKVASKPHDWKRPISAAHAERNARWQAAFARDQVIALRFGCV